VTDVVSKPGEYDIKVTYNSFISGDFIKKFLGHDPISKLRTSRQAASRGPSSPNRSNFAESHFVWRFTLFTEQGF
jgi:hypothetical protein